MGVPIFFLFLFVITQRKMDPNLRCKQSQIVCKQRIHFVMTDPKHVNFILLCSLFFHAVEKAAMVWMKRKLKDLGVSHSTVFVHLSLWVKALCWLSEERPGFLSSLFWQNISQFASSTLLRLGQSGHVVPWTSGEGINENSGECQIKVQPSSIASIEMIYWRQH